MSVDIAELKRRANTVAIIGNRIKLKKQGNDFVACCPFHDEKTPSWKLDNRQGDWLWKCFGCGKGGDVIRFIELFDKISVKDAIAKLESEIVVPNEKWVNATETVMNTFQDVGESLDKDKPKTTFTLEQWAKKEAALKQSADAVKWLHEVRGLSDETIEAQHTGFVQEHKYRIKEGNEQFRNQGWVMFPRIQDGKVVAVKFRSIAEKLFSQVPNMDSRAMYNIETINALEPVYVTEGELDAMILEQAGFRAVSCPSAGVEITAESKLRLKLAECIYLAGDNDGVDEKGKDKPGVAYMKRLKQELGDKTFRMLWPAGKDANGFFLEVCKGNVEEFKSQVSRLSYKARTAPPDGFEDVYEGLMSSETSDLQTDQNRLHWPPSLQSVDDMMYTPIGDGVVIIYSTYTGTGKTMIKTQLLEGEVMRGMRCADLSLEVTGAQYYNLIASQVIGPQLPNGLMRTTEVRQEHKRRAAEFLRDQARRQGTDMHWWYAPRVIGTTPDEVLAFIEQTVVTHGVNRFAIDTFNALCHACSAGRLSSTELQGHMAKNLEAIGKKHGCIFILMCQSNAEADGLESLKKNELGTLRGSREMQDAASAIYLLHRARRPQKDGENPDDTLELNTMMYARKIRYNGVGKPQAPLMLRKNCSLFAMGTAQEPPAHIESGDLPPDDFSQNQVDMVL